MDRTIQSVLPPRPEPEEVGATGWVATAKEIVWPVYSEVILAEDDVWRP